MKKIIAALTTALVAIAIVVVGVAAPASAHTADLTGSNVCTPWTGSATVTWSVTNSWSLSATVSASSNTSVVPLGTPFAKAGQPGATKTFSDSIAAPAANQTAKLSITLQWSDGVTENLSASTTASSTCYTTDASATIALTPATCGVAGTVTEGAIANAKWGKLKVNNGQYTAVATATTGHDFTGANGGVLSTKNGLRIDTFTGTVSPALSPGSATCKVASAAVVTTAATCSAPELVTLGAITHAKWGALTFPVVAGSTTYRAVASADAGYEFADGSTTLTLTGPVVGELTGHACEDYIIVAWRMPSWIDSTHSTWPQTYFTSQEESTPNLNALDSKLAESCGVQYQVDIYYNSPTTATLIAGHHLDGPSNPSEDLIPGDWGVAYKLVQGPDCATPATPTVTDSCGANGTITITPAKGVVYYLNGTAVDTTGGVVKESGLSGTNVVTATAASGYLLQNYPTGGWSFTINTNCAPSYSSSGECTSTSGISTEDVSLTFTNPTTSDATFTVTSTDSTVNSPSSYVVHAGKTVIEVVGSTSQAGGTFQVSVDNGPEQTVTIAPFIGCAIAIAGDPSVTQATCDSNNNLNNDASITIDLEEGLIYTITGPAGFTTLTNLTPASNGGTDGRWVAATGIPAGNYTVSVVAAPGFVLDSSLQAPNWPFTITLPSTVCGIGATAVAANCPPPGTGASITVELNPNVIYTAHDTTTSVDTVLTQATTPVAGDVYTVEVTLSPAGTAAGFKLPGGAASESLGSFVLTADCRTDASWHVGASGTNWVCTDGVATGGAIILVHSAPGSTSNDEVGKVTYTITNTATNAVVYTGTLKTSVTVPIGSYNVHAAVPAGDGIVDNPGTTDTEDIPIVIGGSTDADCDGNLAFTGGTIAWLGFVLAGGMLFLGFALLYMRRRGNRAAE